MAGPQITYGTALAKLIDIPTYHSELIVNPGPPVTINESITGVTETIVRPTVSIEVLVRFPLIDSLVTRIKLDNWRQSARHGNLWTLALDSAKTVNTTLTANAAVGATSVIVASNTGIVSGQTYKLISGPYYQLVTVSGIAGTTISIAATTLDFPFFSGAIFRDAYFFHGRLLDPNEPSPIIDEDTMQAQTPYNRFTLLLHFFERVA